MFCLYSRNTPIIYLHISALEKSTGPLECALLFFFGAIRIVFEISSLFDKLAAPKIWTALLLELCCIVILVTL